MESLLVGIDVDCRRHRVAVGRADGALLDQFDLDHQPTAFSAFFSRIENAGHEARISRQRGHGRLWRVGRPLDELVLAMGWTLLNA